MKINNKFCKIHNLEYNYICPNCVEPFLEKTKFSSLSEIRQYQKENAQKVNTNDIIDEINRLGFMKIKNLKDTSYSGALIYDCKEKATLKSYFRRNKLSFSAYFPSILFLNQTELYLDLIKTIKEKLDCYIINSSGQLHPYLFGAACDFGLRINTPVIGYTKKLLFGYVEINEEPQNFHRIYSNDHLIGFAIPRPNSKKYFYISVGNNISLQKARNIFSKLDLSLINKLNIILNNYIKKDSAK